VPSSRVPARMTRGAVGVADMGVFPPMNRYGYAKSERILSQKTEQLVCAEASCGRKSARRIFTYAMGFRLAMLFMGTN